MLYWFKIIFCYIQVIDFDLLIDLENTSYYLKAVEMAKVCEKKRYNKRIKNGFTQKIRILMKPNKIPI